MVCLACFAVLESASADAVSAPAPTKSTQVTVDMRKEFQVIDDFGASDCWTMQKIGGWQDANRDRIADLLFSTTSGIGLSSWRFNIGAGLDYANIGEGSWRTAETFEVAEGQYDWTRQANERRFLAAAKARGVDQFIAFANSPPARMTRNGMTFSSDTDDSTNLKEGYEAQFARYLADILQFFRDNPDESQRIDFDWISPYNEPQWPWIGNSQEGCRASNDDIKATILALDKELRARNLASKILTPESGILYGMWAEHKGSSDRYSEKVGDYLASFCRDPDLKNMLGNVISSHSYRYDFVPDRLVPERMKFRKAFEEYPGWRYWQTEYCIMQGPENQGGGGRDLTIKTALDVARVIHCDLTICNASAWQWWLAVSPHDYKDGLIYTDYQKPGDPETVYPSKLLWAFGNYSRFVRPGAKRIALRGANNINGLLGSAYKSPSGDQLILVFINISETQIPVSLRLAGLPRDKAITHVTPWVTSATDDLREYPPVDAKHAYSVPARSVVTLIATLRPR
ncbi:MAG: glycoside hydrolase [Candidatus Hydrogenedentales bacterium]|jgi:O-glycosyl hydrolase